MKNLDAALVVIAERDKRILQLEEELEHAIKQYEHWEKEIDEQDKELNQLEAENEALKRRIEVWWSRWNVAHSILDTTQLRQYEEEIALLADTLEGK